MTASPETTHRLPVLLIGVCAVAAGAAVWLTVERGPVDDSAGPATPGGPDSAENVTYADAVLDEPTQKYIWDLEHFTFELEQRLLPRVADALKHRSVEELQAFLTDEFQAVVADTNRQQLAHGSVTRQRWRAAQESNAEVGASGFAQHLLDHVQAFAEIGKAKFRVLKIAARDRDPASGDWTLRLLLSVKGTSAAQQPLTLEIEAIAGARFLTDEDIIAGQILQSWQTESVSLVEAPALLREATDESGLAQLPLHDNWSPDCRTPRQYSAQLACGDWSLDGRPDLVVAMHTGEQWLLRQTDAGRFVDATAAMGLDRQIQMYGRQCVATLFDFDNDGDDDLLLGATLYRNVDGKRFLPVENSGLSLGFDPMSAVVADYDCDGLLDLYVLYQHSPANRYEGKIGWINDDQSGAPNELWRNLGNGRFANVTDRAGVKGGKRHSFAAAWLFANDDHFPDLYVANDFARNSLFLNRGNGTFEDVSDSSGAGDFATSMGVAAGDLDGDAAPEIYVANMFSKMGRRIIAQVSESDYPAGVYAQLLGSCAGNRLYRPLAASAGTSPTYEEISDLLGINGVGWAYAPALTDLDLDGFLDIYATAGFLSFERGEPDG